MGTRMGLGRWVTCACAFTTLSLARPAQAQVGGFYVDSRVDNPDAHVGNGICDDGTGHCTLRAAVEEANSNPGRDTIVLPADDAGGNGFNLTYKAQYADTSRLEVFADLSIEGEGAGVTTISGAGATQIMQVQSVAVYVLDALRSQVLAYSFGGTTVSVAFSFPGSGSRLITGPEQQGQESFILATDAGVLQYSADGQLLKTMIPTTVGGQPFNPADVALGTSVLGDRDNVYASNIAGSGGVYRYNAVDGSVTRFVQEGGTATRILWVLAPNPTPGGASIPTLLVLYPDEHRIAKYSSTGTFLGNLVTNLPGYPAGMSDKFGVLYVSVPGVGVVRYDLTGASLGTFLADGDGGVYQNVSVGFAPDGELFVCSLHGVHKFDGRTGQFGNVFAAGDPGSLSGLRFARDIVFVDGHKINGPGVVMRDLTLAHGMIFDLGAGGLGVSPGAFVRLQEATVEDNVSGGQGAGIQNYGYMDINRVRITNNRTLQSSQGGQTGTGGGIFNAGTLLMSDSLVDHNFGGHGGGLACSNPDGEAQITNTAFIANTASGGGGAVRASNDGYVALNFCTITDNVVPDPARASPNDPTPYGGGIFAIDRGRIDIGNSIVAGNTDAHVGNTSIYAPDCFADTTSKLYSFTDNLIQVVNGSCPIVEYGTGATPPDLITGDPELGPFGDNGGPTDSRQPENGSPAIDGDLHVSPYELFQCPSGDQRFFIRPGGARCDIGSVEQLQNVQFDLDHDGMEDTVDLDPQLYSFSFSDVGSGGNTTGDLISEGEQTLAIVDADGAGLTISADPAGGAEPAVLAVCSDDVMIELGAGQTRTVTCVTASAGPDQTLECKAAGKAPVTLTGSGTSFSGAAVTYGWASPGVTLQQATQAVATGNFTLGTHVVTLTVKRGTDVTTDLVVIKVVDTAPPVLNVPADVSAASCTTVTIGQATATDACGSGSVTITNDAPASYRAGVRIVTWRATDQAGNQTTRTQRVVVGLGDNQACCPAGSHVVVGTSNNDTLSGTAGIDCILGKGGQDTIRGLGGDDIISGGDGDDILEGGDGNDLIDGGTGQDTLRGQAGNDSLLGQAGDDQCYGGDGDDVLFGGDGQDRLFGENGNDTLYGEVGSDRLEGGAGNDTLNGGASTDTCVAGGGTDTILACEL